MKDVSDSARLQSDRGSDSRVPSVAERDRITALRAAEDEPTPGPWGWYVHDRSLATLCGGGGSDPLMQHVLDSSPCQSCQDRAEDWEWGRCTTPRLANARLIAAAPDLLAALQYAQRLIVDAIHRGLCPPLLMTIHGGHGTEPIDRAIAKATGAATEAGPLSEAATVSGDQDHTKKEPL